MENKRHLTEKEIRFILDFIKPLPGLPIDIGKEIANRNYEDHARQLRSIQLYPNKIQQLKTTLEINYYKSQIEAGKSVGALASSSIGEKQTQTSLSSFHQAGQSKVELTTGFPRLEELVNVSSDIRTPSMDIYLNLSKDELFDLNIVRQVALEKFEYTELIDFITDYDISENRKINEEDEIWYEFYKLFYSSEFESCSWSLRLVFNTDILYKYKKTLENIAEIIHKNYADAYCVFSPDNIGIIDVYVQTENLGSIDEIIKCMKNTRKRGKKRDDNEDDNEDNLELLITDKNKEYYFLRDLVTPSILYIQIGGIENIKKCYFQESKDGVWYISTKGSNLKTIIKNPIVDAVKTTSNHLWDIYEVFGIEAARQFMINELGKLITVSPAHVQLLVNCMTYSGKPLASTRYGIDRKQVGPCAKVAFEQPFDNFFQSATLAEKEDTRGMSSSIMMGVRAPTGSGYMSLLDKFNKELIIDEKLIYENNENIIKNLREIQPTPQSFPQFTPKKSSDEHALIKTQRIMKKNKACVEEIKQLGEKIPNGIFRNKEVVESMY